MKWKDKGNELLEQINFKDFENSFWVFGAGDIGRGVAITLEKFNLFAGFIDNDVEKQKKGAYGKRVIALEELRKNEGKIIIAATLDHTIEIIGQVKAEGHDFYIADYFLNRVLPIYLFEQRQLLIMNLAQICVTERCTLKCEHCAHACYAVENSMDMTIDDVYLSADSLFSKIDYIHEFVLIGGEPLLYVNLSDAIRYISEKYRNKIGVFSVTSNSTVIPSDELLRVMKEANIYYRISNYSKSIPILVDKQKRLIKKLEEFDIEYYLGKAEEQWWDYGFENFSDNYSERAVIRKFDSCRTPCREVRKNRLYFCVMARAASENLKLFVGNEDYLNLADLSDNERDRRILLEYNLGYSEKGYLSMCHRCRGKDSINYPVTAAKQMRK